VPSAQHAKTAVLCVFLSLEILIVIDLIHMALFDGTSKVRGS
jgi:hypothetical protein